MTEIVMIKTAGCSLAPVAQDGVDWLSALKLGSGVRVSVKKSRNPKFHRKAFALFKLAFDAWDAPEVEYKGEPVSKSFDQFRKDITVLAGHRDVVINLKGHVRVTAKSLSFSEMDEEDFAVVYKSILNVVWRKFLSQKGYKTEAEIERVVAQLMGFD